jgi:hypothetical protein
MNEKKPVHVFDPILIEKNPKAGNSYRAHTRVPPAWGHMIPEVMGASTEDGPWIEAYAGTPEEALDSLYLLIGRLCVKQYAGAIIWDEKHDK